MMMTLAVAPLSPGPGLSRAADGDSESVVTVTQARAAGESARRAPSRTRPSDGPTLGGSPPAAAAARRRGPARAPVTVTAATPAVALSSVRDSDPRPQPHGGTGGHWQAGT